MKKITMSVVVALFVLITLGLTGCMTPADERGNANWERPDMGDMTSLPVTWNQ